MNVSSSTSSTYTNSASSNKGISGMSGLDTEKLVEEMLSGTQSKIDKQTSLQQRTQWKQELYRDVISQINAFQEKYFSVTSDTSFLMGDMFTAMKAIYSSSAFSVSASSNAVPGDFKMDVAQLATRTSLVSDKVSRGIDLKLDAAAAEKDENGQISLDVTLNGETKTLKLDASSDSALASSLQTELDKSFGKGAVTVDENGGRVKLSTSSEGQTLTLSGSGVKAFGVQGSVSNKLSRDTKLSDLQLGVPLQGGRFTFNINGTEISVGADETLQNLMDKINASDAGVTLTYDDLSDTFRMQAKQTGRGFGIEMSQSEGNLLSAMFGLSAGSTATGNKLYGKTVAGGGSLASSAVPTDADGKYQLKNASFEITVNGTKHTFAIPRTAEKDADGNDVKDADGNVVYKESYTEQELLDAINKQMAGTFGDGAIVLGSDGSVTVGKAGLEVEFEDDTQRLSDPTVLAESQKAGQLNAIFGLYKGQTNQVTADTDVQDVLGFDATGLSGTIGTLFSGNGVSFDADSGRVTVQSGFTQTDATQAMFGNITLGDGSGDVSALAGYTQGVSAVVRINGVLTERNSNSFEVNGLNISLKETTVKGATPQYDANGKLTGVDGLPATQEASATIQIEQNSDAIYDSIKSFIDDYNKLISNLNELVDADDTYKDYAPLTADQKKEMSEREIELWEEKAKEGLLRKDSTISTFLSDMRSILYSRPEEGGLALYDIGIDTGSWDKKGQLVIEDDAALRSAIETKADKIAELFTGDNGISKQMKNVLEATAKTSSGSPGTLVQLAGVKNTATDHENQLQEQLDSISNKISLLKYQYEQEKGRYWKQFNAMEQMISNMNSQSSWLSQMLG